MEIRRLTEHDAQALWNLRLQALESEPEAFGESADEHRQTPVDVCAERLRSVDGEAHGNFVLGAFVERELVGMVGFHREVRIKRRHRGMIWGMFIAPGSRGCGLGGALLSEATAIAKSIFGLRSVFLSVSSTQTSARRLYLSAGFQPYGVEPGALMVGDRCLDEEHMILRLP